MLKSFNSKLEFGSIEAFVEKKRERKIEREKEREKKMYKDNEKPTIQFKRKALIEPLKKLYFL